MPRVIKIGLLVSLLALLFSLVVVFIFKKLASLRDPNQYTHLETIQDYAKQWPEWPTSGNDDWNNPHFDSFYRSRDLAAYQKIFFRLGVHEEPAWSPKFLGNQLKKLTQVNQQLGLSDGSNSFVHIKAHPNTRLFVFSNISGAFHSLLRDLADLHEQQVLDQQLKIANPNIYLVFNGDSIGRSSYSIDTLILISLLLEKNPTQAFYVAGNQERKYHWFDFNLKRELIVRGYPYSSAKIPYVNEIDNFFATLPEAIYVSALDQSREVLRIAFNDQIDLSYQEEILSSNFLSQEPTFKVYQHQKTSPGEPNFDVVTILKAGQWHLSSSIKHGLSLVDQDKGATAWAGLSSPIAVHNKFLDFYEDAYAEISISSSIAKATIKSHFRDVRTKNRFSSGPELSMISGEQLSVSELLPAQKLASSMSLVRGVPSIGKAARRGLNLAVNHFNRTKLADQQSLRLYIHNDDYIPSLARATVLDSISKGIDTFLLSTGTPTLLSYLDLIKSERIAVLFPITGSDNLRSPDLTNLVHFRPSYSDEVKALIKTLREEKGLFRFALFYQDDDYGQGAFNAALKQLKSYNISNVVALPYARGTTKFEGQISLFKKNQPEVLGFFSTASAAQEFIRQLGVDSLTNVQVFGISFVADMTLRGYAKRHGINFLFGSPVPNPHLCPEEICIKYRKAMDDNKFDYDVFSFESYVASSIVIDSLARIEKGKFSPTTLIKSIEGIKNQNYLGFPLNFNRKTRSLARTVWLETNEQEIWRMFPID